MPFQPYCFKTPLCVAVTKYQSSAFISVWHSLKQSSSSGCHGQSPLLLSFVTNALPMWRNLMLSIHLSFTQSLAPVPQIRPIERLWQKPNDLAIRQNDLEETSEEPKMITKLHVYKDTLELREKNSFVPFSNGSNGVIRKPKHAIIYPLPLLSPPGFIIFQQLNSELNLSIRGSSSGPLGPVMTAATLCTASLMMSPWFGT